MAGTGTVWRRGRRIGAAVALAVLLSAGLLLWQHHHQRPSQHLVSRQKAILSQAAQDRFPIVFLGDSFVELGDFPALCGQRVLNAGISGVRAEDVARFAPFVLDIARPRAVLIAVGINDAHRDHETDDAAFGAAYRRIIGVVRKSGAHPVLFQLPVLPKPAQGLAVAFDRERATSLSNVARSFGAVALPLLTSSDGLHPDTGGYARWKRDLGAMCGRIIG